MPAETNQAIQQATFTTASAGIGGRSAWSRQAYSHDVRPGESISIQFQDGAGKDEFGLARLGPDLQTTGCSVQSIAACQLSGPRLGRLATCWRAFVRALA